jgi:hypothetical protein
VTKERFIEIAKEIGFYSDMKDEDQLIDFLWEGRPNEVRDSPLPEMIQEGIIRACFKIVLQNVEIRKQQAKSLNN